MSVCSFLCVAKRIIEWTLHKMFRKSVVFFRGIRYLLHYLVINSRLYLLTLMLISVRIRNRVQEGNIFPHFSISLDTLHSCVLPFSCCPHSLSPFALFMCKQHGPHNHHRMNEVERARGKRWFTSRRIYRREHEFLTVARETEGRTGKAERGSMF